MGMGKNAAWIGIWLALATACGTGTSGTETIETLEPVLFTDSAQSGPVSDIGIRSRSAVIDANLFTEQLSPLEQPQESLRLNLFDDVEVLASRIRWAHLPNQHGRREAQRQHTLRVGDAYGSVSSMKTTRRPQRLMR